ncbi:MAG: hypothetical protein ACFE8A_14710 [Candidatus Hodarchaeota archaeon]
MNIMIMVQIEHYSGAKTISDKKSVKQEINIIKKKAKLKLKDKSFQDAIDLYKNAIVLATNWDLKETIKELENFIRLTQIQGLKELKKLIEEKAYIAEDQINYERAIEYYNKANKVATEIFKLGIVNMKKEIKRLEKKSIELERELRTVYKNYK